MTETTPTMDRRQFVAMSARVARQWLMDSLGHTSYSDNREYYRILGYKRTLTVNDYMERYHRQDIAARIIDLPPQDTWKKPPVITEDDNDDTEFVRAWNEMQERLRLWSMFARADRLARIGRYGILLLGFSRGQLVEPVEPGSLSGPKSLAYLRPFSEVSVDILEQEQDTADPRFGLPTIYNIKIDDVTGTRAVHWSRVLHIAENRLDSEIYALPPLQRVFNRLDDMVKLVGGSAEATWLQMRRGLLFTTQDDYTLATDDDSVAEREEMLEDYVHDLARWLTLEGMEAQDLGSNVVDPSGPFEVVLGLLSAASGIPQRVLIGSAQGELAAAKEDKEQWYGLVAARQEQFAEPEILRSFIDRCVMLGALPQPRNGYDVGQMGDDGERHWPRLYELSDQERAEVNAQRAAAIKAVSDPMASYPASRTELRQIVGLPEEEPEDLAGAPHGGPDGLPEIEEEGMDEDLDTEVSENVTRVISAVHSGAMSEADALAFVATELAAVTAAGRNDESA